MQQEPPEGPAHTTIEILHESPGSDSQETSKLGPQAGSTFQQVAQGASTSADQPYDFEIYEEGNSYDSSILTTMEAPTASLAPIAGDTATPRNTSHGRVSTPDLEPGIQYILDNAGPRVDANVDGAPFGRSPKNDSSSAFEVVGPVVEPMIEAFAKLELPDGDFYMVTYAMDIGRDLDWDPDWDTESSSSQQIPRTSSGKIDYTTLAMAPLKGQGSRGWEWQGFNFNMLNPMPPPFLVPLLLVHPPPLEDGTPDYSKNVSRKHLRIAYNCEDHRFEMLVLGRNGAYVDDEHYPQGEYLWLKDGNKIQVGQVVIRFELPPVYLPSDTGAETGLDSDPNVENGNDDVDEDEERSQEDETMEEEEKEDEDKDGDVEIEEEEDKEQEEEEEEEEVEEPQAVHRRAKGKRKTEPESLPTPKRKGPGRPPKNGIISKREQALLARQAREKAKVAAEQDSGTPKDPSRVTAGKDKKILKQEQALLQTNGKRKYTKRKRATGTDDQKAVRESTDQTDSVPPEQSLVAKLPPKPAKEKKRPKPARSPSPVFDEATLTPEQLQKPPQNYICLIHEALSNSETGAMALPQIYRAMQRKYPYFKLRATTIGWQSSVRHNLGQSPVFRKVKRDGKGWMWGVVPGVSIEREKKRRATPPPVSQPPYYPPGPPPMQYPYSYPGMPPPTGHIPPTHYGMPPRMPPAQLPPGLPPRGPHGFPLPLVNAQSESTYQSPYQSTPPPQQS